ncbi:MAG: glycoside hydrolase family 3 protein [Bacillota bacterium]
MRISNLSLEEKVGQVFMFGFRGIQPSDAAYAVNDLKAGGIIYFARNVGTVAETHALSESLQGMAKDAGLPPLFLSADQEGGLVSRLTAGLPGMPGAMGLGAAGDPCLAQKVSAAIGLQLRAAGINMNLAPVLDVNNNPSNPVIGVRSFGENPAKVSDLGRAAVSGYLSSGICPVGKHFPGHGNTSVDSHVDLPVLDETLESMERTELRPYRAAIAAGLPAIMTAHIVFRALDPANPATMSPAVLQGLLRTRMGFKGLILTDCMEMQAVSRSPGTVQASLQAFRAGADLILISHTRELQAEAYRALLNAVRAGEIPEERLDVSVERILAAKRSMRIPNALDPASADTPVLRDLSREAYLRSVVVLRTDKECFPLDPQTAPEVSVIAVTGKAGAPGVVTSGYGSTAAAFLATALGRLGVRVREVPVQEFVSGTYPGPAVLVTENIWKDPALATLAAQALSVSPHAAVVAVRDPYDADFLPSARTFVCALSPRAEAMEAVAALLTGAEIATGKLPVTLSGGRDGLDLH